MAVNPKPDRKELAVHKRAEKVLRTLGFKAAKGTLPKLFGKLKGSRIKATPLIELGGDYVAAFVWKNGPVIERRSIYGWLLQKDGEDLVPLLRLDWHPSHKGLHVVVNCESNYNLTNRNVVGGKELTLKTGSPNDTPIDPDLEDDRKRFVHIFCKRFGVKIEPEAGGDLLHGN